MPSHPSCAHAKQAKQSPPLKEGRRERRQAHHRSRIETRCGARPVSFSSDAGGARPGSSRELGPHGAGALAFRRPTAASEALKTSARLQAALPGTTGCKREDPLRHQCSEHLAVRTRAGRDVAQAARRRSVWPRPREPLPLRLKEYPRDKASFASGMVVCNDNGDESQANVALLETKIRGRVASEPAIRARPTGPGEEVIIWQGSRPHGQNGQRLGFTRAGPAKPGALCPRIGNFLYSWRLKPLPYTPPFEGNAMRDRIQEAVAIGKKTSARLNYSITGVDTFG